MTWDDLPAAAERNTPPTNLMSLKNYQLFGEDDFLPPQTDSTAINKEVEGLTVRLPCYVMPLNMQGNKVSSFFLAPYYGARLHIPPPPPNQMVYVELQTPLANINMYDAFWVTGKLSTAQKRNRLGAVSYALTAGHMQIHEG